MKGSRCVAPLPKPLQFEMYVSKNVGVPHKPRKQCVMGISALDTLPGFIWSTNQCPSGDRHTKAVLSGLKTLFSCIKALYSRHYFKILKVTSSLSCLSLQCIVLIASNHSLDWISHIALTHIFDRRFPVTQRTTAGDSACITTSPLKTRVISPHYVSLRAGRRMITVRVHLGLCLCDSRTIDSYCSGPR